MLKFSVHTKGLEAIKDKLAEGCPKAEHIVALQVQKDTVPYVPALTGMLMRKTRVEESRIIYPGPQSRYLYYGKLMVDPTTGSSYAPKGGTKVLTDKNLVFTGSPDRPGGMHGDAQSHWLEPSKAENLEKWVRVADKAVKDEL